LRFVQYVWNDNFSKQSDISTSFEENPAAGGPTALSDKTEKAYFRPSDEAIERQTEYDPAAKNLYRPVQGVRQAQNAEKAVFLLPVCGNPQTAPHVQFLRYLQQVGMRGLLFDR
jgi:hypothetical protein